MESYATVRARRLLLDTAPDDDNTLVGGPSDDFDTNMVIILAALLCALICALGLNSIVRCALRCRHSPSLQAAPTAGMKKRDLRRIPVEAYGSGAEIPGTECAICLADFAEGEKVRVLPECKHGFHVACIDRWLLSNSSCPNCRHSVLENKPASREAVGGGRRPGNESGSGLAVAG